MTAAIDITVEQRKTLLALLRRFIPGIAVWAYGSRVKGTARPNSDLDLVAFTTPAQRSQVSELKEALDESNLPFLVDLHVWDEVPEKFREIIRKEYVVLQEARPTENGSSAAPVGRVSPSGRNPTNDNVGLRDEAANPTYGGWRDARLREVATLITKGTTPTTLGMPFVPSGVNYIKAESVTDVGTIDRSKFAFIDSTTHAALRRSQIKAGDLLMSMAGVYLGKVAVVPPEVVPANTNQAVAIIRLSSAVDSKFVAYYLRNREFNLYINSLVAQSAQPNLNLAEIGNLPLRLPTLSEQRAIAHILGTLDDKIALNRRMNETLEAMARALFKAWFVDFDPVHTNAEGRDPGLPQPLANLFPDSFEDSELGEIPKRWKIGRFGHVVEQLRDQVNPLASPDALFHHFSIPAFDTGQSPKPDYGESIKSLKSRVPVGVVLLSKLNPEIERVWMVDVRPGERAVCSTEFLVLRALPPFTRSYVYCLARSLLFRQQIEGLVTGTSKSHQRAQVESILNLAVVVPPSPVVEAFDHYAEGLLARTLECRRESHTLATLRDTLLPRLISGELRLKVGIPCAAEATP